MRRDDRGLSESVQWTMLTPLVLTLVLGIIQLGLWGYARTVVTNAAGAGAEQAAPMSATTTDGVATATAIARKGGLTDISVRVSVVGTSVVATVSGRMPGLIDVGVAGVQAQVTRAKERVTTP